jgi:NitT/TauT family transport system substrate-binding protein
MLVLPTRRRFLATLSFASGAGLIRPLRSRAAEGALETTTVRLAKNAGLCIAPQYVAEELLRAEGFADLRYVDLATAADAVEAVAQGRVDFTLAFVPPLIIAIDSGAHIAMLAGAHAGCFELFGNKSLRNVADLKDRTVGVEALGSPQHAFLSLIAGQAGLDPSKDIRWIIGKSPKPIDLFRAGKIDAFVGIPPEPQELHARNIGRAIINSTVNRPWSQYFCCMLAGKMDYVRNHPVATKRVLRAILKAADLCTIEPSRAARRVVDGAFTDRYAFALETLSELSYRWRQYDAEDTIQFYARRLHEAGMVTSNPQKIIADGADWRFLNELKSELRA